MSPGVATPCPAAPPIPIAKVCFIAPSLTECRPLHCPPAHGRAQIKIRIPVSETPPVNNQLVFRVAGSIHPKLPYIPASAYDCVNWDYRTTGCAAEDSR